ncbi:MAG: lipoyl(octanoyl) transferase [Planctomycetota bacterium]
MPDGTTTRPELTAAAGALEVHLLGLVDFDSALSLQERLVFDISGRDDTRGALLLCEHPPLITLGREASSSDVAVDPDDLKALEIDVRWISRGGGLCVHAPGQLAVYPVLPLERLGLGLDDFRSAFEEALVGVCHEQRVPAKRSADEPGLWSRGGQVGFFGAAVKSWVSYHGMFLNVDPDPTFMKLGSRPGRDERVSSLRAHRLKPVSMASVRESVMRHVAKRFGYERHHVYTGHPLLKRTRRKVCLHA